MLQAVAGLTPQEIGGSSLLAAAVNAASEKVLYATLLLHTAWLRRYKTKETHTGALPRNFILESDLEQALGYPVFKEAFSIWELSRQPNAGMDELMFGLLLDAALAHRTRARLTTQCTAILAAAAEREPKNNRPDKT